MRLALLSDIHGNTIALDAVLADIASQGGVDGYWVLGELAALGHDPIGVLERLAHLPRIQFARGNTDRYLITGERPPPTVADVQADPTLAPILLEVAGTFAWTQGAISATGWRDWLAALPLELRTTLPDGTHLLGVHAAPNHDDGEGIHPGLHPRELDRLLSQADADLICVGHTHWP